MKTPLFKKEIFCSNKFVALSQYGYCISDTFNTEKEAENFVFEYYKDKMHLIRD